MKRRDVHISGDIARDDPIHLDVISTPFVAQRLSELAQSALRGCIRWYGETSLSEECKDQYSSSQRLERQKGERGFCYRGQQKTEATRMIEECTEGTEPSSACTANARQRKVIRQMRKGPSQ